MIPSSFPCWLVDKDAEGRLRSGPARIGPERLPPGELLLRVELSSLNYKDGLAARAHPGVAKRLPQVPGIDAVGVVEESADPRIKIGQRVIVQGGEFGAGAWGGWAAYARAPAELAVPLPEGLTAEEAATLGVAGFTAALSVKRLLEGRVTPGSGEILVTGATGGVGSMAVAILAKLGFSVVALTGKPERADWLRGLGAARVAGREELETANPAPLLKSRWSGGVDTVGGPPLAALLRSTRTGGCVTTCGLVAGTELALSVHPFILRGVSLAGIDSAWTPRAEREEVWSRLAGDWKPPALPSMGRRIGLSRLEPEIESILAGRIVGRTIVEVDA